jgi:hypothetical protein
MALAIMGMLCLRGVSRGEEPRPENSATHEARKLKHNEHNIHKDKKDLRQDRQRDHQDRENMHAQRKSLENDLAAGNTAQAKEDLQQLRQDRSQYHQDQATTRHVEHQLSDARHDRDWDARELAKSPDHPGWQLHGYRAPADQWSGAGTANSTQTSLQQVEKDQTQLNQARTTLSGDLQHQHQAHEKVTADFRQLIADVMSGKTASADKDLQQLRQDQQVYHADRAATHSERLTAEGDRQQLRQADRQLDKDLASSRTSDGAPSSSSGVVSTSN